MVKKYYKNISPDSAKNRIAKLVNAHNAAWASHKELRDIAESKHSSFSKDSYTYKHSLDRAITYSHALRVMGIVEDEILENL